MSADNKTLLPGEKRYVAKDLGTPRRPNFCIYDRSTGSYPAVRFGVGIVKSGFRTEEEAQPEIERLEAADRGN